MKNVLIILVLVVVCASIGYFGALEISNEMENSRIDADQAKLPPLKDPNDVTETLARESKLQSLYLGKMGANAERAKVGGGVGAAVGFAAGLRVSVALGKRKKWRKWRT